MNHLDLCSGIGGFALAAQWAGMTTIGFCEIDPWCRRVLTKNFPRVPIHDDLTTLDAGTVRGWIELADEERFVLDAGGARRRRNAPNEVQAGRNSTHGAALVLTAGYPCQPFSFAGKRMGQEDDRHLWPRLVSLVGELRPARCLFENVAGHVSMGLDDVLADLEALGYACRPFVVPACAVNAPHRRDRIWIVAADADRALAQGRAGRGGAADPVAGMAGEARPFAADADRCGFGPGQRAIRTGQSDPDRGGAHVADAAIERREDGSREPGVRAESSGGGWLIEAESGLGFADDGLPRRVARPWDGDWEAGVPRVVESCPDRVNKLKALGNAVVPQVAYEFLRLMTPEAAE